MLVSPRIILHSHWKELYGYIMNSVVLKYCGLLVYVPTCTHAYMCIFIYEYMYSYVIECLKKKEGRLNYYQEIINFFMTLWNLSWKTCSVGASIDFRPRVGYRVQWLAGINSPTYASHVEGTRPLSKYPDQLYS